MTNCGCKYFTKQIKMLCEKKRIKRKINNDKYTTKKKKEWQKEGNEHCLKWLGQ